MIFAALLKLAETFCGADARARVFEPMMADWQHEFVHSRGIRRSLVLARGTAAFMRSLVMCAMPLRVQGPPMSRFALAFVGFALAAAIFQAIPIDLRWVPWEWQRVQVISYWQLAERVPTPLSERLWNIALSMPGFLAYGIVLGLLPAAMVAADRGARLSRLVAAFTGAVIVSLALTLFVVPAMRHAQGVRFFERGGMTNAAAERLVTQQEAMMDDVFRNRPWLFGLADERAQLPAQRVAMAVSLALLGIALARVRRTASAPLTWRAVAGWWVFGWMAFLLLQYWVGRLPFLPMPRGSLSWIPTLIVVVIALTALRAANAQLTSPDHLALRRD